MRRDWSAEELSELWTLAPAELALIGGLSDVSKLGLAAQLAYWRAHGRFPDDEADLPPVAVGHLAAQLGVGADALETYDWAGRTGRRHRRLILDYLAVADFDASVEARFRRWLGDELLPREPSPAVLEGEVSSWFARERITRPGAWRLDRILRSARAAHDDAVLQRVADRLDAGARERLDALLTDNSEGTAFAQLAADPGRIGLESLLAEIGKLERLRALALPPGLLRGLHPDLVRRFRRRAGVETAWELRRHPDRIRLPLLAFWWAPREADVVDGLVDRAISSFAASASEMGRYETKWLYRPENLAALADLPGQWTDKLHRRRSPKTIVLDMFRGKPTSVEKLYIFYEKITRDFWPIFEFLSACGCRKTLQPSIVIRRILLS